MPMYECKQSRRIADTDYVVGGKYAITSDLAERYASYFERVGDDPQQVSKPASVNAHVSTRKAGA